MRSEEEIIKSKLSTYKPTFNEGDWQAMEKMLDNNKDKKPIFIWWKYGLAIGVVTMFTMGIGAYMLSNKTKNTNTFTHIESTNTSSNNDKSLSNNTNSTSEIKNSSVSNDVNANELYKSDKNNLNKNATDDNTSISKVSSTKKSNSISILPNQINKQSNSSTRLKNLETNNSLENLVKENIKSMYRNEYINFAMSRLDKINEINEERTISAKNTDFAHVKNKKYGSKIPLELSVSALGSGVVNLALYQNKVNIYIDQLSDAGIEGQLMIGKRFGLYTGVSYIDRLSKRNIDSTLYADILYTNSIVKKDKIEGVAIPIGITINLYKHAYVQVLAKVGVNNIIPLRQTTVVEYNNEPNPLNTPSNIQQYGNTIVSSSVDNSFATNIYESTENIASNTTFTKVYKTKPVDKYQAELQIALGVKAKMTKNLAFAFEPAYRLGFKNKVRTEPTHGLVLTGGIIYTF